MASTRPNCKRGCSNLAPFAWWGSYICKSVYRLSKEEAELDQSPSHTKPDTKLWKGIWALWVPNKVKNFLWHACCNALPTKYFLVRRIIIDDPLCSQCREEHETPLHSLWLCRKLDLVWPCSGSWSFRWRLQFLDFKVLDNFAKARSGALRMDGLVDLVTKKPSSFPAIGHSTASDLSAGQGQVFQGFGSPVIDENDKSIPNASGKLHWKIMQKSILTEPFLQVIISQVLGS